ncbi:MAG: putative membrane protein [Methyloprofundus sp.]|nr:MAG: putative membrane protein [Methyloprofundus sp.]
MSESPIVPDKDTLALSRTDLANERTYQAWLRTGLAALVAGLGVYKFMGNMMSLWVLLTIVTTLILLSVAAFLLAAWRYSHVYISVADRVPAWIITLSSLLLSGCSLIALFDLLISTRS